MRYERGLAALPVVTVIGGGFSGLLTAVHLLRSRPDVNVQLVERSALCGRSRAFRPHNPDHLLNVRASNMSAFADQPDHFLAWLGNGAAADSFISRGRYGDYLQGILRDALTHPRRGARLSLIPDEAVAADRQNGSWRIALRSGQVLESEAVVLALGLLPPAAPAGVAPQTLASARYVADPWSRDLRSLPPGDVLLIGSGLTMVDVALTLADQGRRLTALSRRGLQSRDHAATEPVPPPPEGGFTTPRAALRTMRDHAERVGWREAMDSIRPLTSGIWGAWPARERRRFLRHLQPWWDVHRHRMAPQVARRLAGLRESGQLKLMAGALQSLDVRRYGFDAWVRPRGERRALPMTFGAVVNCTAPQGDPARAPAGLLTHLAEAGLLRADPLRLGLDVDRRLQVIAADGRPTPGLFAVGPMTRGAVWEAVAVPDLSKQTAQAAQAVLAYLHDALAVSA